MTDLRPEWSDSTSCLEAPGGECTCYFCGLFELLGRKWTLHMVGHLTMEGTIRFNELKRKLDGISPRTLSDRLTELEEMGLIERIDHGTIPPKVEYRLTDKGRDLETVYQAFLEWANDWDVEIEQEALA